MWLIISSLCEVLECSLWGCLTGFVYRGRHSRTPPPLEGQLEAEWHRTRTGCVCRCDRPCVCIDPSLPVRPHKVCSPGSPPRCPRHSSPLCSFSARQQKDDRGRWQSEIYYVVHFVIVFYRHRFSFNSGGDTMKSEWKPFPTYTVHLLYLPIYVYIHVTKNYRKYFVICWVITPT